MAEVNVLAPEPIQFKRRDVPEPTNALRRVSAGFVIREQVCVTEGSQTRVKVKAGHVLCLRKRFGHDGVQHTFGPGRSPPKNMPFGSMNCPLDNAL